MRVAQLDLHRVARNRNIAECDLAVLEFALQVVGPAAEGVFDRVVKLNIEEQMGAALQVQAELDLGRRQIILPPSLAGRSEKLGTSSRIATTTSTAVR